MLICGDALDELRKLGPNSIDSMVTDPPAGISFMGKEWDKSDGFIPSMTEIFKECLRVLKPGAHAFVWAIPRTSHWTAAACEDAGFEIRDVVTHLFGSGFPKSLDVSKAIDKAAGAERTEVIGKNLNARESIMLYNRDGRIKNTPLNNSDITAPSTPEAKQWQGWGTALKPASEHWILCRKPLSEKTVAKNVLLHGTGALNIDASRVGISPEDPNHRPGINQQVEGGNSQSIFGVGNQRRGSLGTGRWPANLVLSHNDDCVEVGTKKVKGSSKDTGLTPTKARSWKNTSIAGINRTGYASEDGTETVSAWECTEDCAVAMLDTQSGVLSSGGKTPFKADNALFPIENKNRSHYKEQGGASRFFYVAKASKRERNAGCEGLGEKEKQGARPNSKDMSGKFPDHDHRTAGGNNHPTVKSLKLMAYLIKMITPPQGIVLDPFMGSGSTLVAAKSEGFSFVGIEKEKEYFDIAEKRINHAKEGGNL